VRLAQLLRHNAQIELVPPHIPFSTHDPDTFSNQISAERDEVLADVITWNYGIERDIENAPTQN